MVSSKSKYPVLVCAIDNNYAMQLAVTVRSVLENLKSYRKIVLFVIDGGIKESNKRKISRSLNPDQVEINWVKPDNTRIKKLKVVRHLTHATYYRLLIPNLLPAQFNKVIYLDADLIVNEDLGKLWDIDIGENYLLAVQDIGIGYVSSPSGVANYKELGIPPNSKYFCAGVMVINLEKWRIDSISVKTIEYLEQNKEHLRFADQDALNAVLAGKWGDLDLRWNQIFHIFNYPSWQNSVIKEEVPEDVYNEAIRNPYIIHLATGLKPWIYGCNHPAKDMFFQYLDMTAYSGWRSEKTFKNRLRYMIGERYWQTLGSLKDGTKQFMSFVRK